MLKLHSLFLFLLCLAISACGQVTAEKASAPAKSSPPAVTPTPGSGTSNGTVVNSSGFFAKLNTTALEDRTALHIADAAYGAAVGTTNFSSECRVPYGTTGAAADIFCILEIEELDLYFTDIGIQIHVPSDMCTYLKVKPYSFYQFQAHDGPALAHYQKNADGSVVDISNTVKGVPFCQYDHSADGDGNCCTGNYSFRIDTIDSSGNTSTNITAEKWGGHAGKCVSGPAISTQDRDQITGVPKSTIYYIDEVGFNRVYTIPNALTKEYATSIWAANFYNPADHLAGKPEAMTTPTAGEIADATERYAPNDTYTWECLDSAEDLLGRIRIMIRDWNTNVLAEGGNSDVVGADPIDGSALNDRDDWLDWGDAYPASSM